MYLHEQDNYSQYLTDLVNNDRIKKADPNFINSQIKKFEKKIQDLREIKKNHKENSEDARQILEYGLKGYQRRNSEAFISPSQNKLWIRSTVLPELKKARCNKYSESDLLKMFQEGNINE